MIYLQLPAECNPPDFSHLNPFKCVVIIEDPVTNEWRKLISDWLVDCGCKYMMAWGSDCSLWDDAVDFACIEKHNYETTPNNEIVMTTWHENSTLEEVFFYAKNFASHEHHTFENFLVLHISAVNKENVLKKTFLGA